MSGSPATALLGPRRAGLPRAGTPSYQGSIPFDAS
jgi:hypothetical protein